MNAPFFKFYQKDFIASTVAMSAEEVGAFIRLLCYQWEHGEIPDDVEKLARIGGCSGNAIASVLHKFCTRSASGLQSARMEEERASMIEHAEKKRANAFKRWAGEGKTTQKGAKPMQTECNGNAIASGLHMQNACHSEDRRQNKEESLSHRVREAGNDLEPQQIQPATASEEEPAPRGIGSREIPDWPSVKAHADAIGLPEWKAQLWFNQMEGNGWLTNGQPVRKWRPLLTSVRTYWEADGRPSQPTTRNSANGSARQTQREKEAALHDKKSRFGF